MTRSPHEKIAVSVTISRLARLFGEDLSGVIDTARLAEATGIDQIALPDHLAIGPNTDAYPCEKFAFSKSEPWLEPVTTLAAIAGATRRIRLGTGVLIAPLRPTLLLAKTIATLDVLSGGRVDLGVGLSCQREEFEASGVPFERRGARLDDGLRASRSWSRGRSDCVARARKQAGIPTRSAFAAWCPLPWTPRAGSIWSERWRGSRPCGRPGSRSPPSHSGGSSELRLRSAPSSSAWAESRLDILGRPPVGQGVRR